MNASATPWTASKAKKTQTTKTQTAEAKPTIVFKKLKHDKPAEHLKIAVHGQAKTGKTRLALSSPGPVYVIATEPGLEPLSRLFPNKDIYFVDVYEVDPQGVFEVEPTKTLEKIDEAVRQIRALVKENPDSVKTVVFDSVTDLWKWVQEWMKTEILKIDKTARVRQQWDWGYANTKYQNIIMQLLSLPCNLVLTGQDKELYSGPGEKSGVYAPRWQGQTVYLFGNRVIPSGTCELQFGNNANTSRSRGNGTGHMLQWICTYNSYTG